MSEEFKVGDLVQLRSGGPTMTVDNTDQYGKIVCKWFGGKKLEAGQFDPASLIPAPKEEEKDKEK